ncbi:MAG: hypothetical protein JXA77_02105 [Bacteroidales bacterium]|nr:hypothetical protein [Bacteroidales bacterium]MBN2820048.1 hypothetical protein [Bacteroidales bacterium]
MKKISKILTAVVLGLLSAAGFSQTLISSFGTEADGSVNLPDGTVLSGEYILDTRTYVIGGRTVFIEPGTVFKAESKANPEDAVTFVVSRGGKVYAMGTEEQPIVFTTVEDPLDGTYSVQNKEKWGGVVVLGYAQNSVLASETNPEDPFNLTGITDGVAFVEGLPYPDERHHYGAADTLADGTPIFVNDDNSGVLRYVSIRHGGTEIATNNEINGLTMGSVGSGTTIEHIEVVSNGDDGIEFFGGTVDMKYVNIMFCEDDYIDYDQGWTGRIQFMMGLQLPATVSTTTGQDDVTIQYGDNGMECDGDDGYKSGRPAGLSSPQIFNATIIGNGADEGLELKERTNGLIGNSVLSNFSSAVQFNDGEDGSSDIGHRTSEEFAAGRLRVANNLFLNYGTAVRVDGTDLDGTNTPASLEADLVADGNVFLATSTLIDDDVEAVINDGLDAFTNKFNAVPNAGATEFNTDLLPDFSDGFFEYAPYRGAFEPGKESWLVNWTVHELKGTGNVSCPYDVTGDFKVNASDFAAIVGAYGDDCNE